MDILIAIAAGGLVLLCLAGIVGAIVILPTRRSSKSKKVATHWHYDFEKVTFGEACHCNDSITQSFV